MKTTEHQKPKVKRKRWKQNPENKKNKIHICSTQNEKQWKKQAKAKNENKRRTKHRKNGLKNSKDAGENAKSKSTSERRRRTVGGDAQP
jgi:hypothetical protein